MGEDKEKGKGEDFRDQSQVWSSRCEFTAVSMKLDVLVILCIVLNRLRPKPGRLARPIVPASGWQQG